MSARVKRVERKMRTAIEAALEEGYTLSAGFMGDACGGCALGAVVRDLDISAQAKYKAARTRLGINVQESDGITNGFDTGSVHGDPDFSALGAALRADYFTTTEDVVPA